MTLGTDNQNLESFVNVYDAVPAKWEDARPFIVEQLKTISNGINVREIGFYLDQELLSGKLFIPGATPPGNNPGLFRTILRIVVDMGPLPNTATKSVPHGVTVDGNFTLMQLYGAATDPVAFTGIPLPYASPVLNENIALNMNSTNINITTGRNWSNYTRCFVVMEYIQEL